MKPWFILAAHAALCVAQAPLSPERAQLVQIRERMHQNQTEIPNYTCLETIDRANRPPVSLTISAHGGPGRFLRQDIVRLEVAEVNGKEFFAMPGAYNFTETDITTFSVGGMIGNGMFAGFARNVFNSSIASYQFAGQADINGRALLRYDFRVPLLLSVYKLRTTFGEASVGYSGSFWADTKTYDAIRLDIHADDIPPNLGLVSADTRIDYAFFRIGTTDVLLPQSAETTSQTITDWVFRNHISFTHCKAYGAESVISFDTPSPAPSSAPPPQREIEIPGNLTLTTRLDAALDSEINKVGDRITAHIDVNIRHKGDILIPEGTVVTGRIRAFDRYVAKSHHYEIALEFYRLEFPRGPVRFFAELESVAAPEEHARPKSKKRKPDSRVHISLVRTHDLPGVGTISIQGDRVLLEPGLRMTWKTRRYGPGDR